MVSLALAADFACHASGAWKSTSLLRVVWLRSVLPERNEGCLAVELGPDGQLCVEAQGSTGHKPFRVLECSNSADVQLVTGGRARVAPTLVQRLIEADDAEALYERVRQYRIEHAPMFRVISRFYADGKDAAFSAMVADLPQERDFLLSPALLNAAFGALLALAPFNQANGCVPLSISKVEVFGGLKGRCIGVVRVVRHSADTFVVDVDFYDSHGMLAVRMHELAAHRVSDLASLSAQRSAAPLSPRLAEPVSSSGMSPEESLRRRIAAMVHIDPQALDAGSSFMGLGLTSVQLLDLAREIERDTGIELYPTFFFEYQTLSEAARFLADRGPVSAPGIETAPHLAQPSEGHACADSAIAVIGMGCRFAKSDTPAQFWSHIAQGNDLVAEVPSDRWDMSAWFDPAGGDAGGNKTYCRWGSFIEGVDRFDTSFFEMSPAEAQAMDPQLRLLLEVLYHTIEDAGLAHRYRGSRTGVYVGACFREYMDEMVRLGKAVGAYDLTGSASTFLSNRASYVFDLRGPSMTIDVACSSSLVALHLACQALRAGEADTALVGGVNLLLSPLHYLHFSALQALSPTGRCHTFDARADGYVPGEGVAALMLKPLKQALADGDRIHAVVSGSAVNHCGRSNSPTAPSINQQAALLRSAWDDADIDPSTIGYIEAHGTGTRLGDPIEIAAINKAFSGCNPRDTRCYVGSVKSNIGHTEGTAGLAGVIKAIQMLRHAVIPKMANFAARNPLLPLAQSSLEINEQTCPWPRAAGHPRRAGVSSFGIGGGYAHVVVEEAPPLVQRLPLQGASPVAPVRVFPVSAHSPAALRLQLQSLAQWLQRQPDVAPEVLAAYLQQGKEHLPQRIAFVADTLMALKQLLERALSHTILVPMLESPDGGLASEVLQLARDWAAGLDVAWPDTSHVPELPDRDLLLYRFDRARYWFSSAPRIHGCKMPAPTTALVRTPTASVLSFEASKISSARPWLGEHRLQGQCVLPGVVHLEILAQVALQGGWELPISIRDMYWLAPLVGEQVEYKIDWHRGSEASGVSLRTASGTEAAVAELHCRAERPRPEPVALDELRQRLAKPVSGADIYEEVRALGLQLGEYFKTIESVAGAPDECLATLIRRVDDAGDFLLAPSIMDGVNHCLRGFLEQGGDTDRLGLAVPYHVKSVVCYEPAHRARYLHARRAVDPRCYDIQVLDEAGCVLVGLWGFHPRDYRLGVDTSRLPAAAASSIPLGPTTAPGDDLAEVVTSSLEGLMSEVTGLPLMQIRSSRELATLGVDSVAVAQFTRKLNRSFGVDLAPASYFDHKSLGAYAAFLCRAHPESVARVCAPVAQLREAVRHSPMQAASGARPLPARIEEAHASPIAIVGIAGRFPGSENLDELWVNLDAGVDLVSEIPRQRFDWRELRDDFSAPGAIAPAHGAFMDDIDLFAASSFGISRREAELMDPQQRLFLETARELFVDAGYARDDLRGADVGVFVGVVNNEYYELLNENGVDIEAHTSTGMARCVLANRVSYHFDLCGPSEVIDTACSSSLVAVHRAVQSIRTGECAMAVAGGVNILLTPKLFVSFGKAGMLSPDGRCKTFDARANGYVRGEGCGAVLLKRLDEALRDGDPIYGLVRGSGVNHGGKVHSLTVPSSQAQASLIGQVLRSAGVEASALSYVEAHGTGTPMGDPIEINGLKRVFAESGATSASCGVGSIKSNMGHLEGAAGIAGLLKVVLSLQHRTLPASLHVQALNPQIQLDGSPLYVVDRRRRWLRDRNACVAGVSSFGFGGVNAHVLIGGYEVPGSAGEERYPSTQAILLSADNDDALREYAAQLHRHLTDGLSRFAAFAEGRAEADVLADIAYTLRVGRDQLASRTGFVVSSLDELIRKLHAESEDLGPTSAAQQAGSGVADEDLLATCVMRHDTDQVVTLWRAGTVLPWHALKQRGIDVRRGARRIPLPGAPLARQRYWFEQTLPRQTIATAPLPSPSALPELTHPFF